MKRLWFIAGVIVGVGVNKAMQYLRQEKQTETDDKTKVRWNGHFHVAETQGTALADGSQNWWRGLDPMIGYHHLATAVNPFEYVSYRDEDGKLVVSDSLTGVKLKILGVYGNDEIAESLADTQPIKVRQW